MSERHDVKTVHRVVHELLLWGNALGSNPAAELLKELYAKGILVEPTVGSSLGKVDFRSLPPWLH